MIQTVKIQKLRNGEKIQFYADTAVIVEQNNPEAVGIKDEFDSYAAARQALSGSFKSNQKSEYTQLLASSDQERDQALICITSIADGYRHHYNEAKRQAGERIYQCIRKYGSRIYDQNYQAETGILNSLGRDLSENHAADVQEIDQADVVQHLISANQKFSDLFIERVNDSSDNDDEGTQELLGKVQEEYTQLTLHIEAHNTLNPSEAVSTLINKLNSLIEHYNRTATLRSSIKGEETTPVENN